MKKHLPLLTAVLLLVVCAAGCQGDTAYAFKDRCHGDILVQEASILRPTQPEPTTPPPEPGSREFPARDFVYEGEFVPGGKTMPYVLFRPSIADEYESLPLIVWLHGVGERGQDAALGWEVLTKGSFPGMMTAWPSQKFNAYVVCPYLTGQWYSDSWGDPEAMNCVLWLVQCLKAQYNIHPGQVVIMGHSLGGEGVFYYAAQSPDVFCKAVTLSPYYPYGIHMEDIHIPIRAYCGNEALGEGKVPPAVCKNSFIPIFGEENCFFLETDHNGLPIAALSLDEDGNGKSDLMEWLLDPAQK